MLVVSKTMSPGMIHNAASKRPSAVFGAIAPQPTVVTVVT